MERNRANGHEIRVLCSDMGVPGNAYNRIVINRMEQAKKIAVSIGEPGEPYYNSPWNLRLAVAIAGIYSSELE